MERLVIKRSRVVIVICPQLEETVRGIDADVPTVLIENAPGSGDAPVAGSGAAIRRELGIAPGAPVVLYTGTFEAYQGLDLLFAAARTVVDRRPDVRFVLAGGRPDQVEAASADAARRASARPSSSPDSDRPRRSRLSRRRGPARLAAEHGHEHAAEDLSIPPLGPRDRRDAAAHAHAGARRRGRDPDAADARGLRRRHPRGDRRSGDGARGRRARPAARRNEIQLRGVPGAHAAGLAHLDDTRAPQVAGGTA